jgi:hypothetical protein
MALKNHRPKQSRREGNNTEDRGNYQEPGENQKQTKDICCRCERKKQGINRLSLWPQRVPIFSETARSHGLGRFSSRSTIYETRPGGINQL